MLVHHIIGASVGSSRYWCVTLSVMLVVYFVANVVIDSIISVVELVHHVVKVFL